MADYSSSYGDKIQAIFDYYGSGTTIWEKIQLGTATNDDINFALSRIPQMQISQTANGTVLGFDYADPVYLQTSVNEILGNANSNYNGGQYGAGNAFTPRFNGNFNFDDSTGEYSVKTGALDGLGNTVSTIADKVSLGVTAANIGAKLGKAIDETIYNIDPDWWDEHYPTINPDTWTSIAGSEGGKNFIRTLFDIKDGGMTSYVSSEIFAQTYQMLRDMGVFDDHAQLNPGEIETGQNIHLEFITGTLSDLAWKIFGAPLDENYSGTDWENTTGIVGLFNDMVTIFTCINMGTNITIYDNYNVTPGTEETNYKVDKPFTTTQSIRHWRVNNMGKVTFSASSNQPLQYITNITIGNHRNQPLAYVGDYTPMTMHNIPGSTQYPPTNITGNDLQTVLQQLKNTYPQLFTDPIYETVKQPDGTLKTYEYIPVPWCNTNVQDTTQATTGTTTQTDLEVAPETGNKILDKSPLSPPPEQFPDTGTGDSPVPVLPVGGSSSLWSVYNPTQGEVNSFGAWLWSSDFVEQLKKMFNDPMQAIIGIHKVFATPETGARANIKCGYIDSGVSALTVSSQYTEVNCGSVSLLEYFGNVFDYHPYTSVRVFLPFIGIVPLNVADVMRSTISIKYKVDVITGACIAEISVNRDAHKSVIYTYSGSAIVSYPLSSGSYAGVISAAIGVATSLISGSVIGAVASASTARAKTEVNGSFSGAPGAMGGKKPYLIITRPISKLAYGENTFDGYPSGETELIGNCVGFIRCFDVHLRIDTATDMELDEIKELLLDGVRLTSANDGGTIAESEDMQIQSLYVSANGTYSNEDLAGYMPVMVDVPPYNTPSQVGLVVDSNGDLVTQTNRIIDTNGTYDTTYNNSVTVDVEGGIVIGTQYLLNPVWSRKVGASLGTGRIYQLASYIAYVNGSSGYNYKVENVTIDGLSTPCIRRNPAYYDGYISFAEPVPAGARKLFVQIRYDEQSSNYSRMGRLVIGTEFNGGTVKSIYFVNSNMTIEEINNQTGVTINSTNNKSLAMQVVEIDISDLHYDIYLRFHDTNANPVLAGIWYTYDDGNST